MTGPKYRWRVECTTHGSYVELEGKPKQAWCGKCKKALKVVEIGQAQILPPFVGTKRPRRRTEKAGVVPGHQNTDKEA